MQGSITITIGAIDLNTVGAATQWLDVGSLDAQAGSVIVEGEGGDASTAQLTIETSVDGGKAVTVPTSLVSSTTLTPANTHFATINSLAALGLVRFRVSVAEGSAKRGTLKMLLRRIDGFSSILKTSRIGGDGLITITASSGVDNGGSSGSSGESPSPPGGGAAE